MNLTDTQITILSIILCIYWTRTLIIFILDELMKNFYTVTILKVSWIHVGGQTSKNTGVYYSLFDKKQHL